MNSSDADADTRPPETKVSRDGVKKGTQPAIENGIAFGAIANSAQAVREFEEVRLRQVSRKVRTRAIKIAGSFIDSSHVASNGKLLVSVGDNGRVEFARSWGCRFSLDKDLASKAKEFILDKVQLDIDGPTSTASCKALLRLSVTILRNKKNMPDTKGEALAQGTVKISGPGICTVDFGGISTVSHYWKADYWLIVKPMAAHLMGEKSTAGHWYIRTVRVGQGDNKETQISRCTMESGAIDAIDLGACTRTAFVPLQRGIRIEGKNNWGDWKPLRCMACTAKFKAYKMDPDKWGTPVFCNHQHPLAFRIRYMSHRLSSETRRVIQTPLGTVRRRTQRRTR